MRRLALYSDIHGNLEALEAVYADIASNGITERYCLGDLIGYGPDPVGVIDLVRDSGDRIVSGNYDRGVASRAGGCGCYYATNQAKADGERSYEFTDEQVDASSAEWLLGLEPQIELTQDDVRILLCHGSPRRDNEYLLLDRTEKQLTRLAQGAGADAVCHGHIHIPYHRSFTGVADEIHGADGAVAAGMVHFVSSGSVGKPKDGDAQAGWVEVVLGGESDVTGAAPGDEMAAQLGATNVWLGTIVHRVEYDIDAVAAAMRERGLPETLAAALRDA